MCWVLFSLVLAIYSLLSPQWVVGSALPSQNLPWLLPQGTSPRCVWPQASWVQPPTTLHTCIIHDVRGSYLGTWQAAGRISRRIQTGTSASADVQFLAKRSHGGDSTQHLPFTTADTVKPPTNQGSFLQASPILMPTLKTLLRPSVLATHQKHPKA